VSRAPPATIKRARDLIDDDPTAEVRLDDLAKVSGLSRFQVLRGFSKMTGLTPHAYLLQRRVHRARRLIAAGMSLAETAIACGFADQSHMTRLFVRSYGISPGTYAEAMR
ncbi:MAG: helix-turn-helix transcriptional regulator, partial [Rhizobiaceae bacterium]|nr:helix-turn-helix transcriptional regulator [Rhizobiaceae bacterium]